MMATVVFISQPWSKTIDFRLRKQCAKRERKKKKVEGEAEKALNLKIRYKDSNPATYQPWELEQVISLSGPQFLHLQNNGIVMRVKLN